MARHACRTMASTISATGRRSSRDHQATSSTPRSDRSHSPEAELTPSEQLPGGGQILVLDEPPSTLVNWHRADRRSGEIQVEGSHDVHPTTVDKEPE